MSKVLLVVPEAPVQQADAGAAQRTIRGRGLRLGTLDNTKSNADHLLAMLIERIKAQVEVESVVALRKPSASLPAEPKVLDELAERADLVISAMAD